MPAYSEICVETCGVHVAISLLLSKLKDSLNHIVKLVAGAAFCYLISIDFACCFLMSVKCTVGHCCQWRRNYITPELALECKDALPGMT